MNTFLLGLKFVFLYNIALLLQYNIISVCIIELMNDEDLRQNASIASGLNSSDFSLADFSYQNNVVQQTMLQHLTYTHFTGVTVSPLISTLN